MKKILIVTDGKAGHENQSKALCDALGREYELAPVSYSTRLHKAFSYAADRMGILSRRLFTIAVPDGDFDAVVCTGSTAFYPGKVIAREKKIPVCAVLFPGGYRLDFDCILAPAFDTLPQAETIIPLPVNLTSVNEEFYQNAILAFRERHTPVKGSVAVIVGGPNSFATMSVPMMRRQLDAIFAATEGRERWVTTSRRTPEDIERLIDEYNFDYKLIFSREKFNPIPAFVMLCDQIFVTADSTGMISEAVTRGRATVEVLMNLSGSRSKFARFVEGLVEQGYVHIFDGSAGEAKRKIDLSEPVERVRKLLFNNG